MSVRIGTARLRISRRGALRQAAVLGRQTVHVSQAVAVASHRPAAMAVAGIGAAKTRPRIHSRMKHRLPANWEMSCLQVWSASLSCRAKPAFDQICLDRGRGRLAASTGRSNLSRWCSEYTGRNSVQKLSPVPQGGWPALSEWRSVETRTTPRRIG